MTMLSPRPWVPEAPERYVQSLAERVAGRSADEIERDLLAYVAENRTIHERDCVNLNPATNVMNPKAEALLAAGIGSRPSLGYPGDKYEMGLEGIEKIEVLAAELAAEVFGARYAEIRVGSGALANLYVFMMAAKPGDVIIAPPPSIGGHVTHHGRGRRRVLRRGHASGADRSRALHRRSRCAACRCAALATEAHHHRWKPQPVSASDRGDSRNRRRGGRAGAVRRGAHVGHDRRPRLAAAARGRRPCHDHEHLQEPGRPALRPHRHQRRGDRRAPRCHRLSRPHRQFRCGEIRRPRRHAAGLEGARPRLRRCHGRNCHGACRGAGRPWRSRVRARSRNHPLAPVRDRGGRLMAAARQRRNGCGRPTSSPAASACRSRRSTAT